MRPSALGGAALIGMHEGLAYMWRTPWLLATLLFASVDFFVSISLMPVSMALAGPIS
ncbi:hypothetical protein [Jiangella endophytica]|uniref:hypothetical protein n=1 Tax=Jiangella endophytica TaxID=1623398 RepID=UPI001300835C|nr:hypothetical protein [Jiangella endophytica]